MNLSETHTKVLQDIRDRASEAGIAHRLGDIVSLEKRVSRDTDIIKSLQEIVNRVCEWKSYIGEDSIGYDPSCGYRPLTNPQDFCAGCGGSIKVTGVE